MKKSYFEFMDNFDADTCPEKYSVSKKSVKKRVMEKIGAGVQRRESGFRKRAFAMAAVISVTAFAGIAAAAYETGVLQKAVNFFEKDPVFIDEQQVLSQSDLEVIKNNLREEKIIIDSNGTLVELTGSMHDENVIYFFCRLTAPDGTVLDQNSSYEFEEVCFENPGSLGTGRSCSMSLSVNFSEDENPNDNVLDFACVVQCDGEVRTDELNGIILRNLRISYDESISDSDGEGVKTCKVIKGHWGIPVALGHKATMTELVEEPVEVNIPERFESADKKPSEEDILGTGRTYSLKLKSVLISPLSMEVAIISGGDVWNSSLNLKVNTELVMKDGTSEICDVYNAFEFKGTHTIYFRKPIDISNIDYIIIGDGVIDMN